MNFTLRLLSKSIVVLAVWLEAESCWNNISFSRPGSIPGHLHLTARSKHVNDHNFRPYKNIASLPFFHFPQLKRRYRCHDLARLFKYLGFTQTMHFFLGFTTVFSIGFERRERITTLYVFNISFFLSLVFSTKNGNYANIIIVINCYSHYV